MAAALAAALLAAPASGGVETDSRPGAADCPGLGCPAAGSSGGPVLPEGAQVALPIRFASGSARIDGSAQSRLLNLCVAARRSTEVKLLVVGHTDATPVRTARFPDNESLSRARAEAVVDYLAAECGLDRARLRAIGLGARRPVADNATAEGRARNRRIEIIALPIGAPWPQEPPEAARVPVS